MIIQHKTSSRSCLHTKNEHSVINNKIVIFLIAILVIFQNALVSAPLVSAHCYFSLGDVFTFHATVTVN